MEFGVRKSNNEERLYVPKLSDSLGQQEKIRDIQDAFQKNQVITLSSNNNKSEFTRRITILEETVKTLTQAQKSKAEEEVNYFVRYQTKG